MFFFGDNIYSQEHIQFVIVFTNQLLIPVMFSKELCLQGFSHKYCNRLVHYQLFIISVTFTNRYTASFCTRNLSRE
jgi:hypothetical protein